MLSSKLVSSGSRDRANRATTRFFQVLISFIIAVVVYRYCWIDASDPFKCEALLNHGEWLDSSPSWSSGNRFKNWQPPGCIMHQYKREDIQDCFQAKRIVFIGDSTIRQIFWAVSKKMDQERAEERMVEMDMDQKHQNLNFTSSGVTVQFIWDPWLNSTQLMAELSKFNPDPTVTAGDMFNQSASMILLGAPGLWYARHGEENFFKAFKDSIDAIIPYMDHSLDGHSLTTLSRLSLASPSNLLLLAPVQVPRYQSLSPSREVTITPEKIDQMNDYLQQASAYSGADIAWSYNLMTWAGGEEYEESGLHVIESVAHKKADVLLNLRCNADSTRYPFDRTCCSNYVKPGVIQWTLIISGMLLIPLSRFACRKYSLQFSHLLLSNGRLSSLAMFGLVLCYCFYADRTQLFEKSHKQFQMKEFLLACSAIAVGGFLSITKSITHVNTNTSSPVKNINFLSRDQTDEWKGWMQAFILVYHFTDGSGTLWIYQLVRLFVASYLFLTGYGHTIYFLEKKDFSLNRVSQILIRINMLSCTLPFLMRTDYLFYYFAPLASFWFLVVYLTMRAWHAYNSNITFITIKVLVSAAITTALVMIPAVPELLASILNYTCAISWDVKEWRFRTFLDIYIVYVGMVIAIIIHRIPRLEISGRYPHTSIDGILKIALKHHRVVKPILVLCSLGLLSGFWTLAKRSPNKQEYNQWQPYISFFPILAFVMLRNSHRSLRDHHSAGFAWLGRHSLETYVLQYHIWLAGDTKGLLRLGVWNRWVEAAILSITFLWMSWKTADATRNLTSWVVRGPLISRSRSCSQAFDERHSPGVLPQSQSASKGPSREGRLYGNRVAGITRNDHYMIRVSGSLKWRLCLILVVMWACNIAYR